MKPKPLALLKNFTVPLIMSCSEWAIAARESARGIKLSIGKLTESRRRGPAADSIEFDASLYSLFFVRDSADAVWRMIYAELERGRDLRQMTAVWNSLMRSHLQRGAQAVLTCMSRRPSAGPVALHRASRILGWNPGVPPPPMSTQAITAVPPSSAIYKGLAIASTADGDFIYATDFHNAKVDVFDSNFAPAGAPGAFSDPTIPPGYAPFGIRNIGGTIYVTYALQDEDAEDDVPGPGHGFVNAFDTEGNFIRRVATMDTLNSPWGLALAPASFGKFGGDLLVGNFGDGRIHAYDVVRRNDDGEAPHRGMLHSDRGPPIQIDGLWSLSFGNNGGAGSSETLFFTAGPFDEEHGLFGSITPSTPPGRHR